MITKATIDKVFEASRVEEVIADFVQLKRSGSNLKGLSPFVNEKSPSFMVSPVKQIWKDFSSGKGGNAVTFLMEHEHFTYPEALRYLAKKYNIEIEETQQTNEEVAIANEKESLYLVLEYAKKYFQETLTQTQEGLAIGLSYFKERGFNTETIKKFELGYSLDVWDAFTNLALQYGYLLENLEKSGLTIVKEDKKFDRFKGRVMFPIQSMSGRTLGFGGRILINDKKAAKYINSPESEVYHKSNILYGIYHAKQSIAKLNNCYLVEGYTDVIQLHQAGIENVVASSGTALTPEQIRLINRLTPNITLLFDGDDAGLRASLRGVDLVLEAGMNVKICTFPDGEDPDSFAKKTPYNQLVDYLSNQSQDFIKFKASLLIKDANNDPIKKADLIRDMVVSISKIPDKIKREIYIQECSKIMDISEEVLLNTLAQILKKELNEANKKHIEQQKSLEVVKEIVKDKINVKNQYEYNIIEILLLYGTTQVAFEYKYLKINEQGIEQEFTEKLNQTVASYIYLNLQEDEIQFSNPYFKEVYDYLIENLLQNKEISINNFEEKHLDLFSSIIMNEQKYTLDDWLNKKNIYVKEKTNESEIKRLVQDTIISYRECLLSDLLNNLSKEVANVLEEHHKDVLQTAVDYNKLKVKITREIGRVRANYERLN